jgi:hypothetical protein
MVTGDRKRDESGSTKSEPRRNWILQVRGPSQGAFPAGLTIRQPQRFTLNGGTRSGPTLVRSRASF